MKRKGTIKKRKMKKSAGFNRKYKSPQKQQNEEKCKSEYSLENLGEINEDFFSDILSSDSDDSSMEEIKEKFLCTSIKSKLLGERRENDDLDEDKETLERMTFYSMYLEDDYDVKEGPPSRPQYSDGFHDFQPYTGIMAYIKDKEYKQQIIEGYSDQEFEKILNAGLKEEVGLDNIDGNISIKSLAETNFKLLKMDGPTRRIALVFNHSANDNANISNDFRDFMNNQIEPFTYIGGVLLLYKEIGIHIIEGSEYVLLRHFPKFFKSEIYKKLITCKILGIEELSAMKSFKKYACYKGEPPELKETIKQKLITYADSIKFLKKLGRELNIFLKFVYNDDPDILEDNKIPENISKDLPPKEYLDFALQGDWTPGLRMAKDWFYNATVIANEVDDSEFVWPPRSDHFPVHILHTTSEENENLRKAAIQKMKSVKLPCPKVVEHKEKPVEEKKRDKFDKPKITLHEDLEKLLDEEHEYPSEKKLEVFPVGIKGYDTQSSLVDSEELNADLEDFYEYTADLKI